MPRQERERILKALYEHRNDPFRHDFSSRFRISRFGDFV